VIPFNKIEGGSSVRLPVRQLIVPFIPKSSSCFWCQLMALGKANFYIFLSSLGSGFALSGK